MMSKNSTPQEEPETRTAEQRSLREKMRPLVLAAFEDPTRARELGQECAALAVHALDLELFLWRRVGWFAADPDKPQRRKRYDAAVNGIQVGVADGLRRATVTREFRHDGEASPTLTIARAGGGGLAFLAFVAALLMVIGFWLAKRTAPATSSAPIPAMSAAPVHVPAISRTPESTSKTVEAIVDSRAELQRLATMWEQALAQDHVRFDVPSPANRGAKFSDVRRALRVARERISQDPSRFSELLRVTNDGVARMQGAWELLGPVDFGLPEEQQSVRTYCVFSKLLESSSKGGGEKKAESARDLHNFCAGLEPNLEDS